MYIDLNNFWMTIATIQEKASSHFYEIKRAYVAHHMEKSDVELQ